MEIISADERRYVDVGSSAIWDCLYATAKVRLVENKHNYEKALKFLKSAECCWKDAEETAREINLLRDAFSNITLEDIVYDIDDLNIKAPWADNISPVITSCGNYFITADGKDLLYELVSLLVYSSIKKVDIKICV